MSIPDQPCNPTLLNMLKPGHTSDSNVLQSSCRLRLSIHAFNHTLRVQQHGRVHHGALSRTNAVRHNLRLSGSQPHAKHPWGRPQTARALHHFMRRAACCTSSLPRGIASPGHSGRLSPVWPAPHQPGGAPWSMRWPGAASARPSRGALQAGQPPSQRPQHPCMPTPCKHRGAQASGRTASL